MQHATFEYRQKVRLKAAELFADDKYSHSEIGRMLGVSKQSISHWYQSWKKGGDAALSIPTPGRKPLISDSQWQDIQDALLEGPRAQGYDTEFWTLERIADIIEKKTGIKYHHCSVWYVLHRLGWSHQKPERAAKQRDEGEIARWKKETWPDIKKGHKSKEQE
jgi:transposase